MNRGSSESGGNGGFEPFKDWQSNGGIPDLKIGPAGTQLTEWFNQTITPLFLNPGEHMATFIWIGVILFLLILVIAAVTALIRYPSETAVVRMVDDYEQTGTKLRFKQGWKLGWNRRAFRIWVIDLVISLPAFIFVALLLTLGLLVYLSISRGSSSMAVAGTVAAIGCFFLLILALIVLTVVLTLLRNFFIRSAALDGTGIGDSFRAGWALFKRNWKSAALMWLVMVGIGIGFGIAGIILFFLLIPVYLVLILPAVLAAVIPGGIALGIASIFASGPLAWIIGGLVALPFFFTVMFAPLILINAWYLLYSSNVWTLTYREMKLLDGNPSVPELPADVAPSTAA